MLVWEHTGTQFKALLLCETASSWHFPEPWSSEKHFFFFFKFIHKHVSFPFQGSAIRGLGRCHTLSTGARPESAERPPCAAVGPERRRAAHCSDTTSIPAPAGAGSSNPWGPSKPPTLDWGCPPRNEHGSAARSRPSCSRPTRGPAARAHLQGPPPPRPSPPHAQPLLQLPQALRPHGARVEPAARPHHPPPSRAEAERELPRLRLLLRRGFNTRRVWGGSAAAMATGPPPPRPAPCQPCPVSEWQGGQPIREQRAGTGRGHGGGRDGERPQQAG